MRAWHSSGAFFETRVWAHCAELLLVPRTYSCLSLVLGFLVVFRWFWTVVHHVWSFVGCYFFIVSPPSLVLGVAADTFFVFWLVLVGLLFSCWAQQFKCQKASFFVPFRRCAYGTGVWGCFTLIDRRHVERMETESRDFFWFSSSSCG